MPFELEFEACTMHIEVQGESTVLSEEVKLFICFATNDDRSYPNQVSYLSLSDHLGNGNR